MLWHGRILFPTHSLAPMDPMFPRAIVSAYRRGQSCGIQRTIHPRRCLSLSVSPPTWPPRARRTRRPMPLMPSTQTSYKFPLWGLGKRAWSVPSPSSGKKTLVYIFMSPPKLFNPFRIPHKTDSIYVRPVRGTSTPPSCLNSLWWRCCWIKTSGSRTRMALPRKEPSSPSIPSAFPGPGYRCGGDHITGTWLVIMPERESWKGEVLKPLWLDFWGAGHIHLFTIFPIQ